MSGKRLEQAFIFDVFGTLVDWRSGVARVVSEASRSRGLDVDALAFADYWRGLYQPSMEGVRTGNRGYVALGQLHRENLDATLAYFGVGSAFDEAARVRLNHAWEQLPAWADVVDGLERLRPAALLAPCSNGSVSLMVRLSRFAGLQWDTVAGAELAQDYKPKPRVYLASCAALGLSPEQVTMVAAHNSDLQAARDAGLRTAFIPRPTEYGVDQTVDLTPDEDWDHVVDRIGALADSL